MKEVTTISAVELSSFVREVDTLGGAILDQQSVRERFRSRQEQDPEWLRRLARWVIGYAGLVVVPAFFLGMSTLSGKAQTGAFIVLAVWVVAALFTCVLGMLRPPVWKTHELTTDDELPADVRRIAESLTKKFPAVQIVLHCVAEERALEVRYCDYSFFVNHWVEETNDAPALVVETA